MRPRSTAGLALALGLLIAPNLATREADASQAAAKTKAQAKTKAKEAIKAKEAAGTPVDLNSASAEDLEALLEIGPVGAKKIIGGRPYKSVGDLAKAGLSAKAIDAIRPLVTVVQPEVKKADTKKGGAAAKEKAGEAAKAAKVDLNKADAEELQTLPGIGPALAEAIIDGRPYKSVDDLEHVKGIGPAKFAELKDRVTATRAVADSPKAKPGAPAAKKADAAKPAPGGKINLNTASKEDLDSLLGIGPVKARAIIDARPFAKPEDIMKVKGIKEDTFEKIKDRITVK